MAIVPDAPSGRTLRFGLPLTVVLFAGAGVVSYYGVRGNGLETSSDSGAEARAVAPGASITLPFEATDLPPGPNRSEFQVACQTCHSTRLALTQPTFPQAKWKEIVHKMVAAYGAPLTADDEAKAATYLHAVRGK